MVVLAYALYNFMFGSRVSGILGCAVAADLEVDAAGRLNTRACRAMQPIEPEC